MSAEDDAYATAERLIEEAIAEGATKLDLNRDDTRALTRLPPSIGEAKTLRLLFLSKTQVEDLSAIAGLHRLREVYLDNAPVTDLRPLRRMKECVTLDLRSTQVEDLGPLLQVSGLRELRLDKTSVADLSPVLGLSLLRDDPVGSGLTFDDTPATARDPMIAKLAKLPAAKERAKALFDYLQSPSTTSTETPEDAPSAAERRLDAIEERIGRLRGHVEQLESANADWPGQVERLRALLTGIEREAQALQHGTGQAAEAQRASADAAQKALEQRLAEMRERLDQDAGALQSRTAALEAKLEDEITAAINAFTEGQAIKSAVTLWQEKQQEHETRRDAALRSFNMGLCAVAGAVAAILGVLVWNADFIGELLAPVGCTQDTPDRCAGFSFKGMVLVAGVLGLFTLGLWFIRLKMKEYLSERHLALDARERRAFSQAYIGLLAEGDTTDEAKEQRAMVYAALFRPSSDGIIKDEGGIDPSITAALSKLLSR